MNRFLRTLRRTTLVACVALVTGACGYTTRSLVGAEHHTIAVPVFTNATHRHDLEWEVTRAVVEEMQARTDLVVVPAESEADLVLRGDLVDVDESTLSKRNFQRPRESVVFVTAEVEVVDRRTGAVVVPRGRVAERESFVPAVGEDIRTAREEAVRSLAERVVRRLEAAW